MGIAAPSSSAAVGVSRKVITRKMTIDSGEFKISHYFHSSGFIDTAIEIVSLDGKTSMTEKPNSERGKELYFNLKRLWNVRTRNKEKLEIKSRTEKWKLQERRRVKERGGQMKRKR